MTKAINFFNDTSQTYLNEYDRYTPEGYSFRIRRTKVLDLIPATSNGSALDIGSGPGILVPGLENKGYRVTASDAAPDMIKLVHQSYPKVKTVIARAEKLPLEDQSYDLVTMLGLLEYLENENLALKETHRLLKDQGLLVVTFPNRSSPWRLWNKFWVSLLGPLYKYYRKITKKPSTAIIHKEYTLPQVESLLKNNGFELIEVKFYNFKLILYPLDRLFPKLTVRFSSKLEKLDRGFLSFIGTGFICLAKRY